MEDKDFILESARRLERWENTPRPVPDDYVDMNRDELIKLAIYQRERMEEAESPAEKNMKKARAGYPHLQPKCLNSRTNSPHLRNSFVRTTRACPR